MVINITLKPIKSRNEIYSCNTKFRNFTNTQNEHIGVKCQIKSGLKNICNLINLVCIFN